MAAKMTSSHNAPLCSGSDEQPAVRLCQLAHDDGGVLGRIVTRRAQDLVPVGGAVQRVDPVQKSGHGRVRQVHSVQDAVLPISL